MIRVWTLVKFLLVPRTYIWVNITFVRETPKAILILFDGRKAWFPKAWIARLKRNVDGSIKIKISEYHWAKKFA